MRHSATRRVAKFQGRYREEWTAGQLKREPRSGSISRAGGV